MTIALLTHTQIPNATSTGGTSSAIDTTGATLIILSVTWGIFNSTGTPTDSQGNLYAGLTTQNDSNFGATGFFYCLNPSTSATHTFTVAGSNSFSAGTVAAFSGVAALDTATTSHANTTPSSSIQAGSITPTVNNCLVIAGLMMTSPSTNVPSAISGGFSITDSYPVGTGYGSSLAYLVQMSAAAANPTWTATAASLTLIAQICAFKALPTATVAIAVTESPDVAAATVFANASIAIDITESPDAVHVVLEHDPTITISISSEGADTVQVVFVNASSWAPCTDPSTDWTQCTNPVTTWTDCPDPSTNWTVN